MEEGGATSAVDSIEMHIEKDGQDENSTEEEEEEEEQQQQQRQDEVQKEVSSAPDCKCTRVHMGKNVGSGQKA